MQIPNREKSRRHEAGARSNSALRRVKEFPHGCGGISGELGYAEVYLTVLLLQRMSRITMDAYRGPVLCRMH
jgi:hypothetical protein